VPRRGSLHWIPYPLVAERHEAHDVVAILLDQAIPQLEGMHVRLLEGDDASIDDDTEKEGDTEELVRTTRDS
jgi:hypothetical protein